MLMLVDCNFKVVKTCKNDQEFCDYIRFLKNRENQKVALEPEQPAVKWEFMRCHYRFLRIFFENREIKEFQETAEQSYASRQDMLMIYKGEGENPLFLSAPSEAGMKQLKKDWALSYAKSHGLHLITL
jgi:hypothetical protein